MITPTDSVASAASTNSRVVNLADAEKEEAAISDFNDFLTLLTAQMKNQDPLKPVDSTQFVEQLASFATVEQQVGSNKKLSELIEQGKTDEINELATWVGRNVEASQGLFSLDSDGLSVALPTVDNAASAEAIVLNSEGLEVARLPIALDDTKFEWDGALDGDKQAANGQYAVSFNYTLENDESVQVDAPAAGLVREARIDSGGPLLVLANGATIRISDIETVSMNETTSDESET